MKPLKIGMIGLDTSHCIEFTKLLNNPSLPYHVPGGQITSAYPFFSEDLPISKERVSGYTDTLEKEFNITITESIKGTAKMSDAILLTAVDGRKHVDLFKELLPYQLPVFIDKPMTLSVNDAKELFALAEAHKVPAMSTSSLRYAESLSALIEKYKEDITSIYINGPLPMQEHMPGYFWYGIHMIEMAVAALGTGIKNVSVTANNLHEIVIAEWQDGRHAIIKGDPEWHPRFGAVVHTKTESYHADITKDHKPFYASLLEKIMEFFHTKTSPIPKEETIEVIRMIEMINQVR
ncbi:Gfo/Idh/MocA family protein [Falsibacillus albus]|uniref:Gfo/Idh/MocA family oxidoreductase n=1 Tax=Falsibacillus albus TaxID=2478915 RepID=A0A3L7JX53_9BACI|nr:Gfo/Idh/MocA family oxidoreductase [Falsibacillus albus]RLQ94854.1 gfo/Idh/MocA family oxidoreductase [Falsibacillus albus]